MLDLGRGAPTWFMCVDCLKITKNKLSDSRVYTSDVRLIKAIYATPRRRAQSLHPCNAKMQSLKPASQHQCNVKTQGSKPASQHHRGVKMRGSKPAFQHHCNTKTQGSKPAYSKARAPHRTTSQWLNAKLKPAFQLQVSSASQL